MPYRNDRGITCHSVVLWIPVRSVGIVGCPGMSTLRMITRIRRCSPRMLCYLPSPTISPTINILVCYGRIAPKLQPVCPSAVIGAWTRDPCLCSFLRSTVYSRFGTHNLILTIYLAYRHKGGAGKSHKKADYHTTPKPFTHFVSPYWLKSKKVEGSILLLSGSSSFMPKGTVPSSLIAS